MEDALGRGAIVIADRYAISGAVYSAAKGLSLDWCIDTDVGLPVPDHVLYFDVAPSIVAARGEFGEERYESLQFQTRVHQTYDRFWKLAPPSHLRPGTLVRVDASKPPSEVEAQLLSFVAHDVAEQNSVSQ